MLMELKCRKSAGSGISARTYETRIWINPNETSEIIENTGGEPACYLIMKNGNQYDVCMSGNKLACAIIDFNRGI